MKIVQTFWSKGEDVLEFPFHWLDAEAHLMSWALSCLAIREHYDNAVLYTDTAGYNVLIKKLALPYTDVDVCFDNFNYLPRHWGYLKIATYAMQEEPFLFVDADIYLAKALPKRVTNAALAAQNREYGTDYYKRMINAMFSHPNIRVPEDLDAGLRVDSVTSYNMGLFGGSDLTFIKRLCDKAFEFARVNDINNADNETSRTDYNVIFEEIFFGIMVDNKNRKVESVVNRTIRDNGYMRQDFCNLMEYDKRRYFHILGGHKRNKGVCYLLGKTLLRLYPQYYRRVKELFPYKNTAVCHGNGMFAPSVNVSCGIKPYDKFLNESLKEYEAYTVDEVYDEERRSAESLVFAGVSTRNMRNILLKRRKGLRIFTIPEDITIEELSILSERFGKKELKPGQSVIVFPHTSGCGVREMALNDICSNVIAILDEAKTLAQIQNVLTSQFAKNMRLTLGQKREIVARAAAFLLYMGIVTCVARGESATD